MFAQAVRRVSQSSTGLGSMTGLSNPSAPLASIGALFRPSVDPTVGSSSAGFAQISKVEVDALADSITEADVLTVAVEEGAVVDEDDVLVTLETDKINVDIRAPHSGTVVKIAVAEGDTVTVGQVVAEVEAGEGAGASSDAEPAAAPAAESSAPTPPPAAAAAAAPAAPASTGGSNLPPAPAVFGGAAPSNPSAAASAPMSPPPRPAPVADTSGTTSRGERKEKMSRMRMRIAERLKDSQNTYALLTTFQEADMSGLMNLRKQYKDEFESKHGVKLGFMSGFVKAAATALAEMPVINAVIDGDSILYRDYVDISVAVATPTGLVVPVLRNCDKLSFADIEKEIRLLGAKARDGKLSMDDMSGGTFTISNGGVYGSMMGTPIVNPPQSAILGMHAITERAVVVNGEVTVRPMMYLALTYDHRLIDGRDAVTFLRKIKHGVEDPARLLLDV